MTMKKLIIWTGRRQRAESETCESCGCEIETGEIYWKIQEKNYCPNCAAKYLAETIDGIAITKETIAEFADFQ